MADGGYASPTIVNAADFDENTRATFVHLRREQWLAAVADVPVLRVRSIDPDPAHLGGAIEFRHLRGTDGVLLWAAGAGPFWASATIELLEPRLVDGGIAFMPPRDLPQRPAIDQPPNEDIKLIPPPPAPCRVVLDPGAGFKCASPDCSRCLPMLVHYPGGGILSCWCADLLRNLF